MAPLLQDNLKINEEKNWMTRIVPVCQYENRIVASNRHVLDVITSKVGRKHLKIRRNDVWALDIALYGYWRARYLEATITKRWLWHNPHAILESIKFYPHSKSEKNQHPVTFKSLYPYNSSFVIRYTFWCLQYASRSRSKSLHRSRKCPRLTMMSLLRLPLSQRNSFSRGLNSNGPS